MRKSILYFAAFSFLAVSCNKEGFEPMTNDPTVDEGRMTMVTGADLDGGLVPMNEAFTLSGKASSLSYTYKVYAESPFINGTQTSATAVADEGEYVFVAWHTEGQAYGGAISAYKYNGTDYYYVGRVDFDDTDWHDIDVIKDPSSDDYYIYVAGQRNPDSSKYLLSSHKGAVAGCIAFCPGAAKLYGIAGYKEIPLPSFGGNGLYIDGAFATRSIVVGTGNGTGSTSNAGGVFRINTDFDFVTEQNNIATEDVEFVGTDGTNVVVLERESATTVKLSVDGGNDITSFAAGTAETITALDLERNDMHVGALGTHDVLLALGKTGVYGADAGTGAITTPAAASLGSAALGVVYHDDDDANEDLIYVAAGGGGVHVLASDDYATPRALISEYDLVGKFVAPTNAPFNSTFTAKDVSIYLNDKIAVATGEGGVFFIDKN